MAVDHDIVGSVGVEVVPIAPTFHRHMERVVIPAAEQVGQQAGRILGDRMADAIVRQVAAFKAMPKLNVSLADAGVEAQLARLRARMETLSNKRIGIDVDVAAAEAEVRRIDAELQRLGASHPNISVRADTATARAALAELRAEIAAVDAADVNLDVDVDTSGARSSLMALGIQMAVLMAIPLGPVIAAGLGSVSQWRRQPAQDPEPSPWLPFLP